METLLWKLMNSLALLYHINVDTVFHIVLICVELFLYTFVLDGTLVVSLALWLMLLSSLIRLESRVILMTRLQKENPKHFILILREFYFYRMRGGYCSSDALWISVD